MANVTFGRNTPTPYDIRMEGMRAQPSAPSLVNPASRSMQTPVGQVGGLMQTLANTSILAPLLYNAGAAWKGFSKTPQGQLLTDRVGETLSAPGRFLNSALGGNNPLPSFGGKAPRLTQFNPPGFDLNKPVTGADLAQSAQAAGRYSPGPSGFQGGNPAAERAYQAERSSVAQQAKQNPDLQRYQDQAELARQALQGYDPASGPLPGAAQTAQDMGMAIWAKKYGPGSKNDLASKVRPGQSGFNVIQSTLANNAATAGLQMPNQLMSTPQTPSPVPFPTAIPQSGLQIPGVLQEDQLSTYPQFDPKKVDIGLFSKFMQANPKK
jgi:hypothetical protein